MFLKSLTLKGFKSFADATEMALEPGVTVVVGPNGSGKSNVVDAIAWVLGAQAPKAVRSQKMDDVIFAGTAKRPALGRAEVSLTLDNSAGLLPVEFNEVTVTRILFRSGDSEYAINGVPCRLLDVQELLSDAGVGRQQHVIVSQGQIDAVLNARPEDRRAIIEEAAGVLKFRKRKEKAERRLDATEANLLRLQDLVREVRRQLRPLERQAQAAQRHGDLQSELDTLRIHVAGREIAAMRARLESIETARMEASRSEQTAKSDLARLDTEALAIEARLTARGEHDVRDQLVAAEQLRERARGLVGILAERRRGLERDRGQLMDAGLVATLEADVAGYRAELAEVLEGLAGFEPALAELTEEEQAFAAERDSADTAVESGSRAASAAAEVRGELRSVRASVDRSENERRRVADRAEQAARRLAELDGEIERLRTEVAEAAAGEGPLVDELTAAESARLAAAAVLERATTERQRCAESRSRTSARAEALQMALDSARAKAGAERLVGVEGVLGTLLELVTIEDGWADAVEAALGDALAAVVVDGPGSARRALATLRGAGTTGAVIATGGASREPAGAIDGAVPLLGRVSSSSTGVPELLSSLLARAVVAEDVDRAVDIALADPSLTVVTREGDRFAPSGWRIGTSSGGATAAALAEAVAAAETADAALQAAEQGLSAAVAELERARSAEVEVGRRLDLNDGRFHAASEALESAQSRRRELAGESESLASSLEGLVAHLQSERVRMAEMESVLPSLESDEQAEAEAERRRREEQAEVDARVAVLASRRRDLEVRSAGHREREEFLRRRIAETEARLDADLEARSSAEQRRLDLERSVVAVERLSGWVSTRLAEIEEIHAELSERRRRQSDEVREMTSKLDEVRRARVEAEQSLEASRERAHRADLDEAEARLRLETAVETLRRDLDVEPEAAEAAPLPELPEGATAAGRVRELERELRLLGPINPLALEEFNELNQRHQFLEEQLEDVRSTRRDLNRVIAAIDGEIQTVFASAFADVSANFTQLFASLFPGGSGALKLTAPDDLLATGIEVEAKPGGKNVKKLSLLSGGERSLTALAFLFAVFRSRPSPFYVMDEVEAALDDVNLHRFLQLIQEFRREAQLIVVSHQKRTMEAGDSLLGVSMQPGGSSKVVTERVTTAS
ncbi:MAG: chromosome segregation protein SMC [Ilumatobacteraceae bacterium]|nr:chromosome segregation protein SMC [Ilumatobacteraceae bacterium]